MKKITLLFAAIIAGFAVQAQEFQAESNAPYNSDYINSGQAVVWDQSDLGTSGIISDYSVPDALGVYSADDFELLENTLITKITAYGFQNNQNLPTVLSGLALYIYENNASNAPSGDPTQAGTGVVELENISTLPIPGYPIVVVEDGAGGYAFEIDMYLANGENDVVLPAGNYWLVIAPRINVTPVSEGASRWNWYDAQVPANGVNEAHLIDPTDVFGAGATSWTAFSALGLDFGSTAFTIEGDALGLGDNINELAKVYPNPTSTVLNVNIPSYVDVKSANLYNILGQDTGLKLVNGTMNTANLENGVYILNVKTSEGTLTQKVVKQ